MPLLSILVPTYNRAAWLKECLDSLAATTVDCEIVVSDNASTDETPAVLATYASDPRFRIIRQPENIGGGPNYDFLLTQARGRYICMFGDDDRALPGCFETKMRLFETHPELDLVYSLWVNFNERGEELGVCRWPGLLGHSYLGGRDEFADLMIASYIMLQSVVFRRELYEQEGGFASPVPLLASHDWQMLVRYVRGRRTAFVAAPTVMVRVHGTSYTQSVAVKSGHFADDKLIVWRHWLLDHPTPLVLSDQVWHQMAQSLSGDVQRAFGDDPAQRERYGRDLQALREAYCARHNEPMYAALTGAPSQAAGPACAVVLVAEDGQAAATRRCLEGIASAIDDTPFEVIVVDNATTDGTAEFLACLEGDVRVVRLEVPVSEGAAKNRGAALASASALVFLSPEAVPLDGWLAGLVAEAAAHPEAAIVGSAIVSGLDGRVLHAGVAQSDDGFALLGQGLTLDDPAVSRPAERELVAGTCMWVRRAEFERWGGFEPDAELEDLMLCLTARQAGRTVRYTPHSRLWMGEALPDAAPVAAPAHVAPLPPRTELARVLYAGPVYDPSGYADEVRHFVLGLEGHGVPVALRHIGRHSERYQAQTAPETRARLDRALMTSVVPEDFISVIHFLGGAFQRMPQAGYRIGRTMFETDGLPAEWVRRCNLMEEIWVPSDFNVETFRAAGVTTRIEKVPGGVDADRFRPGLTPRRIPGARGKVFLSVFEWSFRKGWDVLLQAWVKAFGPQDDVSLVLRTYPMNQTEDAPDMDAWVTRFLREGLGLERHQVAPIVILKEQIPDAEMPSLFAAASAYVAPSRGEGWGRPQMEAMACGMPVIATRWSGNLEFMTDENSLLIDLDGLRLTDELSELPLYHGQKWAEPSIDHMAALMRRVLDEPAAMAELGRRARQDVERHWTWERVSGIAAKRLREIESEIAQRPALVAPVAPGAPGVVWEGAELSVHSFAHVNREVVRRLIASGRVEVSAVTKDIAEFKPDAALLPVERMINRALTRPTAVTVRHQWPPDFTAPAEGAWVMMQPWEFGGLPDEWVLGMKDAVDEMWVYTSWLKDCYIESGLPADRVHVVPLGVDAQRFSPEGPRYPLKTPKRFKFLFLGGTIPRKGIDALLDAYVSTFTGADDVCLVIKGIGAETFYSNSSPLNGVIRQLMENDGVDARLPAVEFLDAALSDDEVASIYRACDALVHPYRGEGFGLPMAEAMASGLPVIVTGLGAALDFCDETNAYLIPARNVPIAAHELGESSTGYWWAEPDREALGRLMREVVADPETARAKGRAGRARIERDFRWDGVAERVLARLEGLARRVPVRFRPPEPFRPGLAPWPLDAHRRTVFFHQPDWASGAWREVLTSYARALSPDADATLVLWLDPASGVSAELATEALMAALAAAGLDPEAMPDVLLVPEALDLDELARLYTAADWVVSAGDARQAERAALVGRPVLTSLSEEAWREAIAPASPTV